MYNWPNATYSACVHIQECHEQITASLMTLQYMALEIRGNNFPCSSVLSRAGMVFIWSIETAVQKNNASRAD